MNFKLLICSNCENEKEKEDNFLFIGDKNSNNLLKNINNDISIKSIISSSNNNNITNNNLVIIEYPYKYSNSKDNDNFKDDTTVNKQSSKNKEEQNDKVTHNIALPKISYEPKFINKNNINNNISNNISNNINHKEQESKVSDSFFNSIQEEKHGQNKVLLFNYVKNCNNIKKKNNNNKKNTPSKNKEKDKDKDLDNKFNIINNIHNLIGLKVDYPCPDTDSFYTKSNNLFNTSLKNESEKIEKNKIEKVIPIKKKTVNICHAHKKLTKNNINYATKQEKNETKKQNIKNNSNLELLINTPNNIFNTNLKYLNKRNEKIKKNILKKDNTKVKKKFVKNKKMSQNMKQALPSIDLESHSKTNRNSNINIKSKYSSNNFKCLSKSRVRCLSNAFFGDLLLNNSSCKNGLSNLTEKKKKLNVNNSEFFHQKSQNDIYSSRTYNNPFTLKYTKKRKNVVISNHINL